MRVAAFMVLCSGCCLSVEQAEVGNQTTATVGGQTAGGVGGSGGTSAGQSAGGGSSAGQGGGGSAGGGAGTGGLCTVPWLLVSPNVLDFGSALINTTAQKSVTLVNCSTAGVAAISADVIGSDANIFVVDNAPSYLAAGASVSVNMSYSPLALETRSLASVVFMGGDGEKATLSLFGEPAGIALTLGPNPINFGYVALQSTAVACTVVTNQSNMPVTIMGTSEFETDGNAFALATTDDATPPNPFSLPITIQVFGASSKVCFSFTPPIAADYNGQVTLTIDIPSVSGPVVSLTGWGGGP